MNQPDIDSLYPYADTPKKVMALISCACKSGRTSVRIRVPRHFGDHSYCEVNTKDWRWLGNFNIITFYWT